ncbi:MAG: NAD(P)H-hydrate epimerase [Candidatus Micrarchaeia archaeon]
MQSLKKFAKKEALSAEEMYALELNCSMLGISSQQLMENAGSSIAHFISEKFKQAKKLLFFCGTGNNGGDGFAAARMLGSSYEIKIIVVGREIKSDPALLNFSYISSTPFVKLSYYDEMDAHEIDLSIKESDLIIDAIFGTGFRGELKGIFKDAVEKINSSGKKVVAIDLPTGIGSKTCVNANYTVTFHNEKTVAKGLKNVIVKDIGIPLDAELFTGPGDLYLASKPTNAYVNKRDRGIALIIGGSSIYHSAPVHSLISASATIALRSGAGYSILFTPQSITNAVRSISQNQIVKPLGKNFITFSKSLMNEIDRANAIAIGMGISKNIQAQQACRKIVSYALSVGKKIIVDADGIIAIKDIVAKGKPGSLLIVPHDAEFYTFSGIKLEHESASTLYERTIAAKRIAELKGITVLLKGHNTVIASNSKIKINRASTPNLATMGSGDVLSGIIAGFAASGSDLFEAAAAGAYLHSKIGELLNIKKGNHIIARDIAEHIPEVLKEFDMVVT